LDLNKVKFITFNYDISLEKMLRRGLSAIRLFKKKDIDKFLGNGRVLHIYGSISEEPPNIGVDLFDRRRQYLQSRELLLEVQKVDQQKNYQTLLDLAFDASKGLRTIDPGEKHLNKDLIKSASEAVEQAACVYILGYGFDANNNARIGLHNSLRAGKGRKKAVMFTNFGDINRVNKQASKLFFRTFDGFLPPKAIEGKPDGKFFYEKSIRNVYESLELDFDSLEDQLISGTSI
jgi:hypothetical protein